MQCQLLLSSARSGALIGGWLPCLQVYCRATIRVELSHNKTGVGRVLVAGTWASVLPAYRWPMTTSDSYTGSRGTSLGVVTFSASRTLPTITGNGCSFTVTSWSKAGMVKDPSAKPGPALLKW